jgi:molybdopterin-guanine dinucleotide biosynthesis protein A
VHLFAPPIDIPFFNFDAMAELIRKFEKPIIAWIIGHAETAAKMTQELEKRGIAVADEIGKAIRILSALTMRK